ncbi:MAG: hypothetical protein GC162_15400 [Planctomycetes bacterium]|nr:hypothetical protein [Planctomycetota bacterium]
MDNDRFLAAVLSYHDGLATEAEVSMLSDTLSADPSMRDVFASILIHIRQVQEAGASPNIAPSRTRGKVVAARPRDHRLGSIGKSNPGMAWTRIAIAAAVLLVGAVVAVYVLSTNRPAKPTRDWSAVRTSPSIATLTDLSDNATFGESTADGEAMRLGKDLSAGPINLVSGKAQIMFASTAVVEITGPSTFEMTGRNHGKLSMGTLNAYVPAAAHGFTVELPSGVRIIDLGTAFELRVGASGGARLFVRQGQVSATNASGAPVTVGAGYGVAFDAAGRRVDSDSDPWLRRRLAIAALHRDPSMVRFIDPESGASQDGVVVVREGTDDAALKFDGSGAQVMLTDLGVKGSLTIAAWIKPARVDSEFSAIVMTPHWLPGGVHFQLHNDQLKVNLHDQVELAAKTPIIAGRWQYVAAVIDMAARRVRLFIDGRPAGEADIAQSIAPDMDKASVGVWVSDVQNGSPVINRPYTGEMNDVAIFDRALSDTEITEFYQATNPLP